METSPVRTLLLMIVGSLWGLATLLAITLVTSDPDRAADTVVAEAMADPTLRAELGERVSDAVIASTPLLADVAVVHPLVHAAAQSEVADPVVRRLLEANLSAELGGQADPVTLRVTDLIAVDDPILAAGLTLVPPVVIPVDPPRLEPAVALRDRALPIVVVAAAIAHLAAVALTTRARTALAGCGGVAIGAAVAGAAALGLSVAPRSLTTLTLSQLVSPLGAGVAIAAAAVLAGRAWLAHTGRWRYAVHTDDGWGDVGD